MTTDKLNSYCRFIWGPLHWSCTLIQDCTKWTEVIVYDLTLVQYTFNWSRTVHFSQWSEVILYNWGSELRCILASELKRCCIFIWPVSWSHTVYFNQWIEVVLYILTCDLKSYCTHVADLDAPEDDADGKDEADEGRPGEQYEEHGPSHHPHA